ncbi:MAG: hypothetical protein OXM02_12135 [Bacteroidota bacterium]|nr:hypothetical protein [Bacteroidota bacterium]MDE2835250.1 hypothetical protein [Bacteroidota bacterium]
MRRSAVILGLAVLMAVPVQAQFRQNVPDTHPPARLYDATGKIGTFFSRLFNPQVFQMSHSFEMSAGSFGGQGYSMGMYTNTMAWQFSDKLAARMDVAMAYSPQNRIAHQAGFAQNAGPRIFLRNAQVDWKPAKNIHLQLQVRQNPYGRYGGYGRMGYDRYGYSPYARHYRGLHRMGYW